MLLPMQLVDVAFQKAQRAIQKHVLQARLVLMPNVPFVTNVASIPIRRSP
jgi:hypothetical protein